MTRKEYAVPELLITPVFTEAGFATSPGGAGYSDSEGTENMTHDDSPYLTL